MFQVPVPHKKEDILAMLCDANIPISRGAWYIKMINAYYMALAETAKKKRVQDSFIGQLELQS